MGVPENSFRDENPHTYSYRCQDLQSTQTKQHLSNVDKDNNMLESLTHIMTSNLK